VARIEGGALERDLEPVSADDAMEAAADRLHKYAPRRTVEWDRTLRKVTVRAESRRFELLPSRRLYTGHAGAFWFESAVAHTTCCAKQ
jgi:hypothetical protein